MATQEGFFEEVTFELRARKKQAIGRVGEFQQGECSAKALRLERAGGTGESEGESEGLGTHHVRPCLHFTQCDQKPP